jgi:hypothetical protein
MIAAAAVIFNIGVLGPGSMVIRGWVVDIVYELYLGTVWRVMPSDLAKQ